MELDLTIVAGSRPDLLLRTIQSFHENLLRNFRIRNVLVNIDLFGGDQFDREKCVEIIKTYYPDCKLNLPTECSFGRAIKWLWGNTTSDYIFHLEDDWILHEPVFPNDISSLFDDQTSAITLLSREHGKGQRQLKDGTLIQTKALKKKVFGLTIWRTRVNRHGTSPGFFNGEFARTYASYINSSLDLEKQSELHINPSLFNYSIRFYRKMFLGKKRREIIEDIGRPWRNERNLKKIVVEGKSIWFNT